MEWWSGSKSIAHFRAASAGLFMRISRFEGARLSAVP
jgi:hypothetical protein